MPVTAATQQSPSAQWNPELQSSCSLEVSTTPAGLPSSSLACSIPSPFIHGSIRSDQTPMLPPVSPNYFGIILDSPRNPPDSNPGPYAKKNWETRSQTHSSVTSPDRSSKSPGSSVTPRTDGYQEKHHSQDSMLKEIARNARQHQKEAASRPMRSSHLSQGQAYPDRRQSAMDLDGEDSTNTLSATPGTDDEPQESTDATFHSPLELPQTSSPSSDCPSITRDLDPPRPSASPNSSLSWPLSSIENPGPLLPQPRHADTLPAFPKQENVLMISPEECAQLLRTTPAGVLLLDVRPFPQFSQANITGSLNLCIPTTLLKRPSFNTKKLQDTFVGESERREFAAWPSKTHIIVYDASTGSTRDSAPLVNVLKKFIAEGWKGHALILRGGFAAFATRFPGRVRLPQTTTKRDAPGDQSRPMNLHLSSAAPIAGGCALPDSTSVEPFFGNIRQNMDLVGGVGQMPIRLPDALSESQRQRLPNWLRVASDSHDHGRTVSERFLGIERRELERMKEALSAGNAVATPTGTMTSSPKRFRVAGIEQGSKNRYNDIYPFDHSRVRLLDVARGDSDYVNANHIKAEYTNRSYIATQAPVPATFSDFWRVVWEQNVRVIVALTAEIERGQVKCHPYWESGQYGPFQVKVLTEKKVPIDWPPSYERTKSQYHLPDSSVSTRDPDPKLPSPNVSADTEENPYILIRHFTLSHSAFPFQPIREVRQLQYSYWPDFGTTSQPTHLIRLIEQCNKLARAGSSAHIGRHDPEPEGQRPILVHCSAGCGRTGTFCTVDSVIDMLKRVRLDRSNSRPVVDEGNNPSSDHQPLAEWVEHENIDLVAKTVEDFRTQRPSMVQNLRQFVLCYESVLEWVTSGIGDDLLLEQD